MESYIHYKAKIKRHLTGFDQDVKKLQPFSIMGLGNGSGTLENGLEVPQSIKQNYHIAQLFTPTYIPKINEHFSTK